MIYSMYDMCSDEYAGMEVGYVESVVFVQDIKNNAWVPCEDEIYKTEDLEKITCGIVLYHFDDCFFYSSEDRHWRRIEGMQSVENFQGLMCYHDLSDKFPTLPRKLQKKSQKSEEYQRFSLLFLYSYVIII